MTPSVASSYDVEPTPEFNARGLAVLDSWRQGELPFEEAVRVLHEMAREAADSGHLANQGRAQHFLGYIQHYRGNLTTSIMHYEKARLLFGEVGNHKRVARIDLNQGENYRNKGEFSRARRLYRSAYEAATTLEDSEIQAIAITNEGLTLISLKDTQNARKALEEALYLTENWPEDHADLSRLRCEVYHGLATLDLLEKNAEDAWQNARNALYYARANGETLSIGYAYRILGDVMTETGSLSDVDMPSSPDECYRAAIEVFRTINAEGETGRTIYCHAKSLARRGKRRAAAQLFREAMVIFTRLGMTDDAAKAAEMQLRVIQTGTLSDDQSE